MKTESGSLFKGIFPALVTPLNPDGSVNVHSLGKLIERMYDSGADGLYLCGSTGEGLRMQAEARQLVAKVATELSPKSKQLIVHVGAGSLDETLHLARHAASLGVSAVSSLPLSGLSADELPGLYRAIASAVSVPIVAYYFPGYTGYSLSFDQLSEICDIRGVEAVKFTDYDLYTLSKLTDRGVKVLNGRDEILIAGLIMGAVGGIGSIYNLIPSRFVDLFGLASEARWEEARKLQLRVTAFITVLLSFPLLPAIKQALGWSGIDCGQALADPHELTPAEKERLRTELDTYQDLLAA